LAGLCASKPQQKREDLTGFDEAIGNPTVFYGDWLHFPELICTADSELFFHSCFSFAHDRVLA